MGRTARAWQLRRSSNRWSAAMPQPNDLSLQDGVLAGQSYDPPSQRFAGSKVPHHDLNQSIAGTANGRSTLRISEPRRRTNGGMRPRLCNGGRIRAAILTPMRPPLRDRKFADSSLEQGGFELPVPARTA